MEKHLKEEVDEIREKLKTHRELYANSESNVRAQVINPLLDALGWITKNPKLVKLEQSTDSGGKPDYELLGSNGKRVLYVEAKKLGTDLINPARDKPLYQLSEYLFQQGINFGVLTDGAVWVLVKAFDRKPIRERVVWSIDIREMYPSLGNLLQIIPERVENLEDVGKKHDAVVQAWHKFIDNPVELLNTILPKIKTRLADDGVEMSTDDIRGFAQSLIDETIEKLRIDTPPEPVFPPIRPILQPRNKDKRYTWVQIDKEKRTITYNKDILLETAEWLIRRGHLKPQDMPILLSKRQYLIAKEPKHPTPDRHGKYDFRGPKPLSNGLWMHTNFDTQNYIRYARFLLKKCGYPESILQYGE